MYTSSGALGEYTEHRRNTEYGEYCTYFLCIFTGTRYTTTDQKERWMEISPVHYYVELSLWSITILFFAIGTTLRVKHRKVFCE